VNVNFPELTNDNPRNALGDFVIQTRNFLDDLVRNKTGLFHPELLAGMTDAWRDAYALFEPIAARARELSLEAILEHGLYGAQLKFKLAVVRFLHEKFLSDTGVLRRLIGAIDTLLGSILGALHANEAIKEIKEFIEHSLKD
jgi:hypothetical protein